MTTGELKEMAFGWFLFGYLCLICNAMTHEVYRDGGLTWSLWTGSWTMAIIIICIREGRIDSGK